jgi:hypothetical protein
MFACKTTVKLRTVGTNDQVAEFGGGQGGSLTEGQHDAILGVIARFLIFLAKIGGGRGL